MCVLAASFLLAKGSATPRLTATPSASVAISLKCPQTRPEGSAVFKDSIVVCEEEPGGANVPTEAEIKAGTVP